MFRKLFTLIKQQSLPCQEIWTCQDNFWLVNIDRDGVVTTISGNYINNKFTYKRYFYRVDQLVDLIRSKRRSGYICNYSSFLQ